jgi:prepilin peptidase CpaA
MTAHAISMFSSLPIMFSLALTALLLAASLFDVTQFRIPNLIPLLVTSLFLMKAGIGIEAGPIWSRVLVSACMFAVGFLAFSAGLLGGGDVKLMAALALWFDASNFADFVAVTGIAGGVLGILLLLTRRTIPIAALPLSADASSSSFKQRLLNPAAPLPYAVPISIAALWLEWS